MMLKIFLFVASIAGTAMASAMLLDHWEERAKRRKREKIIREIREIQKAKQNDSAE